MKVLLPSACLLLGLVACSSGRDPEELLANKKKLVYTNPTQGTYQWVQNTALSTSDQLVLDLVGPAGTQGRGVAFQLQSEVDKADWVRVSSGDPEYAQNGTVWKMGSGSLPLVTLAANGKLDVGLGQKGQAVPSQDLGASLLRVALKMKAGAPSGSVSLAVTHASLWPESGAPQSISLSLGSLKIE